MRFSSLLLLALAACVGDDVGPGADASQSDVQSDASTDVAADVTTDVASEASPCAACDGGCFENVCGGGAIVEISSGGRHACAVLASGSVWCWGADDYGQAGSAAATTLAPTKVAGLSNVVHVSAGTNHTCAVTSSHALYCWGANDQGQLGHDPSTDGLCGATKCDATPSTITSSATFQSVSAGANFTCAVDTIGTAYCWGDNQAGQLGLGGNDVTSGFVPAQVSTLGPNVASISAGTGTGIASAKAFHACALKTDGTVWCWGADDYNQLGGAVSAVCPDSNPCSATPLALAFAGKAIAVVAANAATCAIMASDGSVQCLGANFDAQLGSGALGGPQTATTVTGLTKVIVKLTAGATGTCAGASDGTTWCWGLSNSGELGNGTTGASTCGFSSTPCSPTPQTAIGAYAHVSRGGATVIGVRSDGTLWGWGNSASAELGATDAGAMTSTPIAISGVP